MAYEIYLGGCALYGVSSVEESVARNVTEHDAIGSGVFTMPKNAGLKSWNIKLELTQQNLGQEGWRKASVVLEDLRDMLNDKNGQRLVIVSDQQKLSKLALLRDIKYETSYQGIYSVSLSLVEYVKARVKSSGVPSVTRPGTRPKAPDKFKALSAYDELAGKKTFEVPDSSIEYPVLEPSGTKPENLAGLKDDAIVRVIKGDSNSAFITEQQKEEAAITGVMVSAYEDFDNSMGSE
ncbi:hypothetical protein ACS3UN_10390 [Oscillospiraceae bacterium LTW-04]|nr:hypothetical protein RBH76_12140 [Oscillospiraceae bacterium MB24-C1]